MQNGNGERLGERIVFVVAFVAAAWTTKSGLTATESLERGWRKPASLFAWESTDEVWVLDANYTNFH
jgi:hypothetical protein